MLLLFIFISLFTQVEEPSQKLYNITFQEDIISILSNEGIELIDHTAGRESTKILPPEKVNYSMSFSSKYSCFSNGIRASIVYGSNFDNSGISVVHSQRPDSVVLKDGKWFQYRQSKVNRIQLPVRTFKLVNETKSILGYKCKKFKTVKGDEVFRVAASLPATISPIAVKGLKGAVLGYEKTTPELKVNTIAISIR